MKKINFILLAISLLFISCDYEKVISPVQNENGVVVAKQFTPEFRGSSSSLGLSMSGDLVFSGGDVHAPESFTVAFQCDHGDIFTIDDKRIFSKIQVDDTVIITFKEVYLKYDNGKKQHLKYIFIDANKLNSKK